MSLNLNYKNVTVVEKEDNNFDVVVSKEIDENDLLSLLNDVYNIESNDDFTGNIFLRLRGLSVELLCSAIKYSLNREDVKDPLMILNIINFIKIYNWLPESYFESEDNYITSLDDFIDLKLLLRDDLKAFSKKLSIYFISLFKSYNKFSYTPSDIRVELPNIYKIIMLSTDIMTLSGIFATSNSFDTNECVYISDGLSILSQLLMKHSISMAFFDKFAENNLKQVENDGDRE